LDTQEGVGEFIEFGEFGEFIGFGEFGEFCRIWRVWGVGGDWMLGKSESGSGRVRGPLRGGATVNAFVRSGIFLLWTPDLTEPQMLSELSELPNSHKLLRGHRFVMIARIGSSTLQVRINTRFAGTEDA
jgi:hypothetical protein